MPAHTYINPNSNEWLTRIWVKKKGSVSNEPEHKDRWTDIQTDNQSDLEIFITHTFIIPT